MKKLFLSLVLSVVMLLGATFPDTSNTFISTVEFQDTTNFLKAADFVHTDIDTAVVDSMWADTIKANYADIDKLNTDTLSVDTLYANYADIRRIDTDLLVVLDSINTDSLEANYIYTDILGIGTHDPTSEIEIKTESPYLKTTETDAGNKEWQIGGYDYGFSVFENSAGLHRIYVKEGGNIGFNTTTPDYTLDVAGTVGIDEYIYHNDDVNTYIRFGNDLLTLYAGNHNVLTYTESSASTLQIDAGQADITLGNNYMFLGGTEGSYVGNVGFNTNTPIFPVTMGGIETASNPENNVLAVKSGSSNQAILIEETTGGETWRIGVNVDGDLHYYNSGGATPAFVLSDGDNVGIGITNPTSKLHLPLENDFTTPTISFGDGNSGFYEGSDNILYGVANGANTFGWTSSGLFLGEGSTGNVFLDKDVATATVPGYNFVSDNNTGVGWAGTDELSLIAGGEEIIRATTDDVQINKDIDHGGNYTLDDQSISNLASHGAGYWFDGVDDDIIVADNSELDFGTDNFTLSIRCAIEGNNIGYLLTRYKSFYGYIIQIGAGGYLYYRQGTGSALTSYGTLIGSGAYTFGEQTTFTFVVDRTVGTVTSYQNGNYVTAIDISANTATVNTSEDLFINSSSVPWDGSVNSFQSYNKALTATEVKNLYSNANIPHKYEGASNIPTYESDFSAGVDSWSVITGSVDGNQDGVSDGVTSYDNVLLWTTPATSNYVKKTALLNSQKSYRLRFKTLVQETGKYLKPTANVGELSVVGTITKVVDGTSMGTISSNGIITITETVWGQVDMIVTPNSMTSNDLKIYTNVLSDSIYIYDFNMTLVGNVADYTSEGVGHTQWQDNSGNENHGSVSGAIATALPNNHTERYYESAMTNDVTWSAVVPAGYSLEYIMFEETAGNTATLDLGLTAGTSDVFVNEVITASSITTITINKVFSLTADQTLYLNDDDGGSSWNSASVNATLVMRKIQ